jgi:histone acetyltransferase (RNA polymerase elongator complex component)
MRRVTVPFFVSHAGCPHRCVFCDQRAISGSAGSLPDADEIVRTVSAYRETAGNRPVEVAFFGGSFTSLPRSIQESLLNPLAPLMAAGEVESVRVSARPDALSADDALFLRGCGVQMVEIGVQSMDDGILRRAGRGHFASDVEGAFRALRSAGLGAAAQLMPGLPGDTLAVTRKSLRRVMVLEPAFLRIYPTVVISGTPLAALSRSGEYAPLSLDEGVAWGKVLLLEALRAGVPVIRMGLQETDVLASSVEAGPYHPAFRQLVEGELFHDLLRELLPVGSGAATVRCSSADLSSVIGQRRCNIVRLARERGAELTVIADAGIPRWRLHVESAAGSHSVSVLADLHYEQENDD